MHRLSLKALFLALLILLPPALAQAAGDLTLQDPVEIKVSLGDEKNAMRFFPDKIEMETGKLYRLLLVNPSPQKHYFYSAGMADAVFTRKVQINGGDGKAIAEVKGQIREIEVYPGGTAEWWLVPVKAGSFDDLVCTIPGHGKAGMVGSVTIR